MRFPVVLSATAALLLAACASSPGGVGSSTPSYPPSAPVSWVDAPLGFVASGPVRWALSKPAPLSDESLSAACYNMASWSLSNSGAFYGVSDNTHDVPAATVPLSSPLLDSAAHMCVQTLSEVPDSSLGESSTWFTVTDVIFSAQPSVSYLAFLKRLSASPYLQLSVVPEN